MVGCALRARGHGVRPAARGAGRGADHGEPDVLDAPPRPLGLAVPQTPAHHPEAGHAHVPQAVPVPHPGAQHPRPASGTTAAAGKARSYATDGGRVVFEMGAASAELVSATPEPGWSMQVWSNTTWIRVNFARDDGTTVSVFCTWNDHAPQVDIVNS